MDLVQYDCIICLSSYENSKDIKNLCVNFPTHILCNDCYWHMVTRALIEKKDTIHCPYCRREVQKLEEIDISVQTSRNPPLLKTRNGKLHGKCIYYYLDGSILESIEFINGKKHGHHISYYIDGITKSDYNYFNGKMNGTCYLYYEDGSKHKIMNYKKDLLDGEYKEYKEDGYLIKCFNYKNGSKHGRCIDHEIVKLTYPYYEYQTGRYITHHYVKDEKNYINGELVIDKKNNR